MTWRLRARASQQPHPNPHRVRRARSPRRASVAWVFERSAASWLVVLGLAPAATSCEQANATPQTQQDIAVEAYPVASPTTADTFVEREYVAEVRAARYAEIRARVGGIVEVVAVDEGQHVDAGQHLFSIAARHLNQDLAAARAATAVTKAELEAARLEQENTQLLYDKNVVSEAPLGQAKATVQALEARLEELNASVGGARVQLGYARVTAPFGGTVNRIPKKAGSAIAEEELLTTIADTSELHAYFRISERDYLQHGADLQGERAPEVWLKRADGSLFAKPGIIDAVANEVDRETGTIAIRARFENEDGSLKHGSSGTIVLKTKLPGALLVPQASTFEVQGNMFVYAVDETDVVRARQIVTRERVDKHFVVESGLATSDKFVVEGAQQLRDGVKIEPLLSPPAAQGG